MGRESPLSSNDQRPRARRCFQPARNTQKTRRNPAPHSCKKIFTFDKSFILMDFVPWYWYIWIWSIHDKKVHTPRDKKSYWHNTTIRKLIINYYQLRKFLLSGMNMTALRLLHKCIGVHTEEQGSHYHSKNIIIK